MNRRNKKGGPGQGPRGKRPDFAGAAEALGVTEEALKEAMGDPQQGRPDIKAAAEALNVTEEALENALGRPKGGKRPPRRDRE